MSKHRRRRSTPSAGTRRDASGPAAASPAPRAAKHGSATGPARARRRRHGALVAILAAALLGAGWWLLTPTPAHAGEITVYKSPTCQCCELWLRHMRWAGFAVTERNVPDMRKIKTEHRVPDRLASCHTSVVGGYVVEGHVPADLIQRLIDEQPAVAGLADPGMPAGSPGMESAAPRPYEVLTFTRDGETAVYATR